jgi:DNA-binding CsgD family transcriptional regulator
MPSARPSARRPSRSSTLPALRPALGPALGPAELRRHRAELVDRTLRATSARAVFAEAAIRLRRLVDHDAAAWVASDPGTGLPTAPLHVEGIDRLPRDRCAEHWRAEFLVDDVALFRDLARAATPAAGLRATVGGDGPPSPRHRRFLRPLGFDDELRAVLRTSGTPWGTLSLWRREGRPAFTRGESALVAGLSEPLGEALRRQARPVGGPGGGAVPGPPGDDGPGLMLFDADGELVSLDDRARGWLDRLPDEPRVGTDLGVAVPVWLLATVFRAAAVGRGRGDGTARARVRSRHGRWLVCHASCLADATGERPTTAVVIDTANPAEVAPIIVDAYDLTEREREVTRLVARGAGTREIADRLYLSPHTVRDHLKAIFAKTGVTTRGELTAHLYTTFPTLLT